MPFTLADIMVRCYKLVKSRYFSIYAQKNPKNVDCKTGCQFAVGLLGNHFGF